MHGVLCILLLSITVWCQAILDILSIGKTLSTGLYYLDQPLISDVGTSVTWEGNYSTIVCLNGGRLNITYIFLTPKTVGRPSAFYVPKLREASNWTGN